MGAGFPQSSPKKGFMLFGKLPADGSPPGFSQNLPQFFQGPKQTVGGLIEHRGAEFLFQLPQNFSPLFFVLGQKGLKGKSPGRQSGKHQPGDTGSRPRHCRHRDPRLQGHSRQLLPRVGDPGHAGVGNQGDFHALPHFFHQFPAFFDFIILVVAGHGSVDLKMVQQLDAVSGILRRDQIRFF